MSAFFLYLCEFSVQLRNEQSVCVRTWLCEFLKQISNHYGIDKCWESKLVHQTQSNKGDPNCNARCFPWNSLSAKLCLYRLAFLYVCHWNCVGSMNAAGWKLLLSNTVMQAKFFKRFINWWNLYLSNLYKTKENTIFINILFIVSSSSPNQEAIKL